MSEFIKEFYFGNIEPQARSTRANKAISKQLKILSEAEEYLTNKLDGEGKSKLRNLISTFGSLVRRTSINMSNENSSIP